MGELILKQIAHIENDLVTKFGVPRQSGLVEELSAKIIFEPEYRNLDALRGLEGFSHLWLIWGFSEVKKTDWSPTVRPPRLGGNKRMGVFATRSPFRPNPVALSSVKLVGIENTASNGTILRISGADLMNGTPVYDIKPYLRYTDCHPDASDGFAGEYVDYRLDVDFPEELLEEIPEGKREALIGVLECDPRPSYQEDPERRYGLTFGEYDIHFTVADSVLRVIGVEKLKEP